MLSNRLTFSLTSLILIFAFGLVFVPTSVMAAPGGPTVTIGTITGSRAADTTADPPETGITVEVTYSVPVIIAEVTVADLLHTLKTGDGTTIGTAGSQAGAVATIPATLTGSPPLHNKFLFTLPDIDDDAARTVTVWVPADGVSGHNEGGTPGPANQESEFRIHTLPSVLPFTAALTAAPVKDANDADIPGRYTLTLTVKNADDAAPADADVDPAPTVADIMIEPMGAATAVNAAGAAVAATTELATGTTDDGIYTQDYQLGFGFDDPESVTLTLASGYMANSPSIKLPPPAPAPTVNQNPPDVTITVSEHDSDARTFRVDIRFTPNDDSEGNAGEPISFDLSMLTVTDANDMDVSVSVLAPADQNERKDDNLYQAILQYGRFSDPPFTVSINQDMLETTMPMDAMDTVGMTTDGDGNGDGNGDGDGDGNGNGDVATDNPPMASITVDNFMESTGTFDVTVRFTPAEGEGPVTGFDHTGLTVVDSSDPAVSVPVTVPESTDANPVEDPLTGDNLYAATLKYNPRLNASLVLPLVVTINQDVRETSNPMASASVGMAEEEPAEEVVVKAKATFSGTLNLAPNSVSIITVTLDKAAMLTKADIDVDNGKVVSVRAKEVTAPTVANTVWEVAIQEDGDPFTESITVTIADDSMLVEPAAMKGSLTTQVADGTLNSITPSTGADDTAVFTVTLTFAAALPAGADVVAADLKLTPTTATVTGIISDDRISWQVRIKPTAGMDTKIELSDAGKLRFAYAGAAVTVKKKAGAVVAGDVTAAHAVATATAPATTTISKGLIAADGFAVINYTALPDLEYFFDIGGSITLYDADTEDDKNSRTVVISEILWGLDFGEPLEMQRKHQFIELYNTTAAPIDLAGWTLTFVPGNVRPTIDIDQVSNRGPGGWEVDTGDTGKSGRVAETHATDQTSLITPARIVSMYRNINYTHVQKEATKETVNRGELVKGIPGGNAKGSWKNSEHRETHRWILSTPGNKHIKRIGILQPSAVAGSPFRINEIGNDSGGDNDWVELHNTSDSEQSLKNYALSMVTAKGTDARLFHFHDQDWKVPAKGFIVISTRHPSLTDLATGKDISIPDADELNKGLSHLYAVKDGWNLQDDGKFALILRNAHDKSGKAENLIDVVAARSGAFSDTNTSLWPLALGGNPHENVIDGGDEVFSSGKVYQRNSGDGRGEKQFAVAGYTGIGYDVKAAKVSSNHGTPGYDNGANRDKIAALMGGVVTISEIMFDLGDARRNLPQWIELHNSSATEGVNLNGWKLHIENAAALNGDPETNTFNATITLGAKTILPNQTVLIASRTGNVRDPNHFPPTRVANLWTTKAHRDALEMTSSTDAVLSTRGFSITLSDKDGKAVDQAGNLDGNRRTRDEPAWMLPMSDAPDSRSSILRVYEDKVALDGTMMKSWILASDTILAFEVSHAYYGNADDVGSPGYREGGPLPVSLSKFRPERLKDTGEIVVRWATESELNNAGFNILRSEKRNSDFTKVHFEAGQGTTSERSVYEWKDTTAKPNVVYYYQIQDVSLDGDVTTLRTTHLRGNVTAAGKITTTWGEIKALR